jgi:hypothetical protein
MKAMQEKIKSMANDMNDIRNAGQEPAKRHHYSLLYDAVMFTGEGLDDMSKTAMAGYVELAANAIHSDTPASLHDLRIALIELGFNTSPPGSAN